MMFFKAFTVVALAVTSLADRVAVVDRRQTTTAVDYNQISTMLDQYMSTADLQQMIPTQTETLAVSVPTELKQQIMTAVPMKVIIQLMNPEYRSSVASDFKAGNTPAWYENIDPSLQSYFQGMASSIKNGEAVYTVTNTPTPTADAGDNSDDSSSDSEDDDSAARPAGIDRTVLASAVGMAGVLGLALAL